MEDTLAGYTGGTGQKQLSLWVCVLSRVYTRTYLFLVSATKLLPVWQFVARLLLDTKG